MIACLYLEYRVSKGHPVPLGTYGGAHFLFCSLEPAMDESQGPGHGASASQDLLFTSQLTPVPNYTAW